MRRYSGMKFLWLEGVFDEKTVKRFESNSPASNYWQTGFINALQKMDYKVYIVGHVVERIWPFGRLLVKKKDAATPKEFEGVIFGFINSFFLRRTSQYFNYLRQIKAYLLISKDVSYTVTFSCLESEKKVTASILSARYIKKNFGIPWICIVADGVAPHGADQYIYLTWSYFKSISSLGPKMHIDGGVSNIDNQTSNEISRKNKVLMYMGALTEHGGAFQLVKAFSLLKDKDIRLWVCGRGKNEELLNIAKADDRINIMGFVSESRIIELASKATAFVNPRPVNFKPNELNYPSKILHYFSFCKPVLSTMTPGISDEYYNVLNIMPNEGDIGHSIQSILNMEKDVYYAKCQDISNFNEKHSWEYQVARFVSWLEG